MTHPTKQTGPAREVGARNVGYGPLVRSLFFLDIPIDLIALLAACLFLALIGAWIAKAYPESERRVARKDLWPDNDPDDEETSG